MSIHVNSENRSVGCTTLEKFENAALLLRLGLPSTLIRHENASFAF